MEDNQKLRAFLDKPDKDISFASKRTGKFDKLFGVYKRDVLIKIKSGNLAIKNYYDELYSLGIIKDSSYGSFFSWVKRNIELVEPVSSEQNYAKEEEIVFGNYNENINDKDEYFYEKAIEQIPQINEEYNSLNNYELFEKYFFGFNMNNEYDENINPIPITEEISKQNIFEIFKYDHVLNNEKIAKILLYEVSTKKRNIFKDVWNFLLMNEMETLSEYYSRLEEIINSSESYSYGITNGTGSIHDIGFHCGINSFKIIRSRY
jgi:hypothetical protein